MTLPDFLVIGVPRSGTTSLAHYVRQHPDVYVAPKKESHYWIFDAHPPRFRGPGDDIFARHTISDRAAYEALFAGVRHEQAVGESSVYYFHHLDALERAREAVPDLRVVAVLRDPIERAYSAYMLMVRDGRETRTFAEALALEDERLASGWEWGWGYRRGSGYAASVRALQDRFGDRLLLLRYDELDGDAVAATQQVFAFLGVDASFRPDVSARLNPGGRARSAGVQRMVTGAGPVRRTAAAVVPPAWKSRIWHVMVRGNTRALPLEVEDRAALAGAFDDDLRALAQLTGWDLADWPSWPGNSHDEAGDPAADVVEESA